MAISQQELTQILTQAFPSSNVVITDLAGDDDHYALEITHSSFNDISLIAQHRLVKEALKDILHRRLHALSIKTIGVK